MNLKNLFKSTILFLCLLFIYSFSIAQVPYNYWHFDALTNPTGTVRDSMGVYNLNYSVGNPSIPFTSGGQVGKHTTLSSSNSLIMMASDLTAFKDSFAFEFIFKPGRDFNTSRIIQSANGAISCQFVWPTNLYVRPYIQFYTEKANGSVDDFQIVLDGIGRKNWGYYTDGSWHHMVFQYNCQTGRKEVWVDGQLPAGFSKTTSTGSNLPTGSVLYINWSVDYVKYYGAIDEIATHRRLLTGGMVREHYNNMVAGQHYAFTTALTTATPAAVTGAVNPDDYPAGQVQTNVSYTVPPGFRGPNNEPQGTAMNVIWSTGTTRTAEQQLRWYPLPRYRHGHGMLPNVDICGINYAGGNGQTVPSITTPSLYTPISQVQKRTNMLNITTVLAQRWNMHVQIPNANGQNANFTNLSHETGVLVKLANDSVHFPLSIGLYRAQLNGNNPAVVNQGQAASTYMQNSSGAFLKGDGSVKGALDPKLIRLTNAPALYAADGNTQRATIQALIAALSNRPATRKIDLIWENAEWYPILTQNAVNTDPVLNSARIASGLDWYTFISRKYYELSAQSYDFLFMNLPGLTDAKFQEYTLTGSNEWLYKWSEVRKIGSIIEGDYHSTGDYYLNWPQNWGYWDGPRHGISWASVTRMQEIGDGDDFNSPFVCAGYNMDEQKNVTPGQYLGIVKILYGMGAKRTYNSYFGNNNNPFALPENWIWQMVHPNYVQAAVSRHETEFDNSKVLIGDYPYNYIAQSDSSFRFKTDDLRRVITVRKVNGQEKYLIFGTIQNNSNQLDTLSELEDATFTLPGVGAMTVEVRRQGSIYYLDNTTPAAKIFYQLDGWHEMKHPDKWSQDMIYENELYDDGTSAPVTEGISGTDYTNAVTYLSLNDADEVSYDVQRSELSTTTRYFWIRARSKNGSDCGVTVSGIGSNQSIECITNTSWAWYRVDKTSSIPIRFSGMTAGVYTLILRAINNIEIDKIALIESAADVYGATTTSCSGVVTASISPVGPTTLCSSATPLTLTASAGTSYLWSTGAITQAISVATSGTYTVTVTVAGVGSDDANTVVTVNGSPVIAPIANTTNICPEDSASFADITISNTGTAGTLSWHTTLAGALAGTGAVTDSITATAEYYARIVTGAGCIDVDSVIVTIVNCGCATPPSVYAGADKTICTGATVTMTGTKGVGTGTTVWSGGTGGFSNVNSLTSIYTPSLADIATGYVDLRLFTADPDGGGPCVSAADTVRVTIGALPSAAITASATMICQGQTATLTAPSSTSYLWSTGATTQAISVTTAGTYTVTVTNSAGCTKVGSAGVLVNPLPNVTVWPTDGQLCGSGNVTFTASPATSYLWSNSQTTQSISVLQTGTYTVTVTDAAGCTNATFVTVTDTCSGLGCVAPYNLTISSLTWWSGRLNFSCTDPDVKFILTLRNTQTGKVINADYNKKTRTIYMWGLRSRTTYEVYVTAVCTSGNKISVTKTFKTK